MPLIPHASSNNFINIQKIPHLILCSNIASLIITIIPDSLAFFAYFHPPYQIRSNIVHITTTNYSNHSFTIQISHKSPSHTPYDIFDTL